MNDICLKANDESNSVIVKIKDEEKTYPFDWVADERVSQQEMYNEIGEPLLHAFFEGYNCTLFTYGQTGSGKTYTMLGPFSSLFNENEIDKTGLTPRILKELFLKLDELKKKSPSASAVVKCSCFEIYNEQVIDLVKNKNFNFLV